MKAIIFTTLTVLCLSFSVKALRPVSQCTLSNPCTPSVTIMPVAGTYGCYSFVADNGIPNDPDSFYSWDFGDNSSATGKTVYHCYSPQANVTNYLVSLTYQTPALCGVMPNVQTFILIVNPPASTLCVSPTPSISVTGYSVVIYAGSFIPEIMSQYHFGDGYWSSMNNSHTYNNCGNYIVTFKSWDMNQPNDTCYGYNAVNISCDGTTGIEDRVIENSIELLFPNPVSDKLYFVVPEPLTAVAVKDARGRECYRKNHEGVTKGQLDLEWLAPGVYAVVFIYKDGRQRQVKFIRNNP
jgi:hypothetical protein